MGTSLFFIYLFVFEDVLNHHNHKKRKDNLEARAVFLIFSLELGISVVAVQGIHQISKKWLLPVRSFFVKMTLRLF